MTKTTTILLALTLLLTPTRLAADDWTEQEVAIGKLCWNEATANRADCAAIALARGHYDLDTLRRMHPRALAPRRTDGRRWIAGLNAALERPEHWPEERTPWETRGRAMWTNILRTVRQALHGGAPVCSERPQGWGGREVDAARLRRILANGGREVCTGTANLFFRFQ